MYNLSYFSGLLYCWAGRLCFVLLLTIWCLFGVISLAARVVCRELKSGQRCVASRTQAELQKMLQAIRAGHWSTPVGVSGCGEMLRDKASASAIVKYYICSCRQAVGWEVTRAHTSLLYLIRFFQIFVLDLMMYFSADFYSLHVKTVTAWSK